MFNVNPLTTGLVVFVPYGMINSGGFRPSSKGGGVVSKQNFRASTWSKHKGGTWAPWVPPLDPPLLTLPSPKGKLLLYPQLLTTTILGDI